MSDDQLYRIEGSKIWLSPTAREFAAVYFGPGRQGERRMAEYLRMRQSLGDDYETTGEAETDSQSEDAPLRELHGEPSVNIEDRRQEAFVPSQVDKQIWGPYAHDVAPQVQSYYPTPLANALGFQNIGQRPPPVPQTLGPFAPRWPAAFRGYQRPMITPFD
jgi:hypothetical protein